MVDEMQRDSEQLVKPKTPEEQININELIESLEAYEFFSNQVKVNITNNQGLRLILDKLTKIEEKLDQIGSKDAQIKP